jgi:hypothetical protein
VLSDSEITRYARHIALREVGGTGQERLLAARVEVEGAGPLADAAAVYLRAAGVGDVVLNAGRAGEVRLHAAPGEVRAGLGWVTFRPCASCFRAPRNSAPTESLPALAMASGAAAAAEMLKLLAVGSAPPAAPLARRVLFLWPGTRVENLAGCEVCR